MPEFDDARVVDQLCWEIRLSDFPRGLNRARIDELFNGWPPLTQEEVEKSGDTVNVNFLEGTRLAHDARSQFSNGFLKPGYYFTCRTDAGRPHQRDKWNNAVTRAIGKRMKRSACYTEKQRSAFALDVMHGIGPGVWADQDDWCPEAAAIADLGIPARTYLHMKNLPFFYVYHSWTTRELKNMVRGPNVDPGWNLELANKILEWLDRETAQLMGSNWPEIWSPEKASERVKGDGGFFVGDQVPTCDVFDFYFYDGDSKETGWKRRMILDSWGSPQTSGAAASMRATFPRKSGEPFDTSRDQFLYNGGDHVFAQRRENIVAFQFADLSAVAPFQYHSVRSLGFLMYAVLHLQNRLRCKLAEATFETLMQLFRVKSMEDVQRTLQVTLANRSFIDESVQVIPAQERWQPNVGLVEFGLQENANLISANASSYTQNQDFSRDRVEKTRFQVMAELNATTQLVSTALGQAYSYANFEYAEILRRFMRPNSKDPDVRDARADMLTAGIPEKYLVAGAWETEPERIMGGGNKTLELTIAQQLMEWRDKFDPEPQRDILRYSVLALTDDAARAEALVPEEAAKVTDAVHDAQLTAAALMQGLPVGIKTGINHIEVVETLLMEMALIIQQGMQGGGMVAPEKLQGLMNLAQHIRGHIAIIAQDKAEKPRAKQYLQALGKMENELKAFAQRLQQAMQKRNGQGQAGGDPKDAAKIQAMLIGAQAKAANTRESHAARTVQRDIQFQQEMRHREQEHQQKMRMDAQSTAQDLISDAAKSQADSLRSLSE